MFAEGPGKLKNKLLAPTGAFYVTKHQYPVFQSHRIVHPSSGESCDLPGPCSCAIVWTRKDAHQVFFRFFPSLVLYY